MSTPSQTEQRSLFILCTSFNKKANAQDEIRRGYLKALAEYTGRDTIIYASAFTSDKSARIPDPAVSVVLDDVQGFISALDGLEGDELDLILHSPGGSMRAADQIVQYLRGRYRYIRAIIPENAMSAATMIACACDEIVMGEHSAIGPIDPQVLLTTGSRSHKAPAQAILDESERADHPAAAPLPAEKTQSYSSEFLNFCRSALDFSRNKVAGWLDTYMFRDLKEADRPGRRIAHWLGNANEHETHSEPINMERARSAGLRIGALEQDVGLQQRVLSMFHATMVTFGTTSAVKMIENQNGRGLVLRAEFRAVPVQG